MAVNICFCAIAFFISLLVMLDIVFHFKKRAGYKLPPSPLALPIIGHMHLIGSVPYRSFHKLSIQYGPLIYLRLGSITCMVVSSPELTKDFLTTNELNFASRPVTIAVNYLNYNSSGFAFAPSGTLWSFMKKVLMSEFLGGQALMKYRHIRRDEIHSSVQLLIKKSATGDRVNVSEELLNLSNNIIMRMMGSIKFYACSQEGEEIRSLFNLSDAFWLLRNMDLQGYLKKSTEVRRRYDIILERIMHEREEARTRKEQTVDVGTSGNKVKDLLDILLDVSEDTNSEIKLSRNNIKAFLLNSALHEGVNDKCDQYRTSRMNRDVRGQHFDLLPFGTGRRGCPGTGLSLLEGPTVLSAIIQCLDWKVVGINGSNVVDMTERPGVIVPMANPIIHAISTRFNPF
ncbi:hypothetical protein MKW92_002676 [Papaver armeniacum]|nr:hypothetical protein MKW92_002676 [Papaver armeniacum]